MEKINLEIYLQEADPVGAPNWDGKTVIYLTYEYPVVGLDEGTVLIGKLDEDVEVNVTFRPRQHGESAPQLL